LKQQRGAAVPDTRQVSRESERIMLRVVVSASAADRLRAARDVLSRTLPGERILIVGASRGAADDLARDAARLVPATFGVQRLSLTQLAAKTALVALAAEQTTPSSWLGAEAVAARTVFDATCDGSLRYFAPVAATPGFPRALARTLQELRLAGLGAGSLSSLVPAGPDLAWLLDRFEACFAGVGSVDRAALFATAAGLIRQSRIGKVILLDIAIEHSADRDLVDAIVHASEDVLATVPRGDHDTLHALESDPIHLPAHAVESDLTYLRQYLFDADAQPPVRTLDGSVEFFSAPGEGRECVEIARRVIREARAGVRFDEMAVLVRSPQNYFGLLEHALRRAGVPAWFERGTERPHPAGRAFLALLACAAEQLSAARFAEYLSLGQVPAIEAAEQWVAPQDEALGLVDRDSDSGIRPSDGESSSDPEAPIPDPVPAPWRWEKLLVEAAVIGQDAARWKRRLAGKAAELTLQIDEAERQDGGNCSRGLALRQLKEQLEQLHVFAVPVIEELAAWPAAATWGTWLDAFTRLVPRVLRTPARVLRVLADLRPLADIGPIDLDEARRVLSERLLTLDSEPPARRFGRLFVATPQQVRGRSFRVVFVPGLAERLFPQKPREDPLLLDEAREEAGASLQTQSRRLAAERLLLQLAAGAAADRLYVSYPRIELTESRARVPSFYALDVVRAATGAVPDYEWLEEKARQAANASLAWPAPLVPGDAIDDFEHDLAVLRRLLDEKNRESVKGHAHYLLKLNECLRRSVIDRWRRGEPRWSINDGLVRVTPDTRPLLDSQRLTARPYSLSALQRFSACPYQFLLAAVYRLQPLERPEPLQRLDPLTRGSLFHDMQARFFRELESRGLLPVTHVNVDQARVVLDEVISAVAERKYDELAPAVDRVWADEIASIRRDLHGWLHYLAADGEEWLPKYFEFAFGAVPGERDVHSVRDEVTLEGGFQLRGAVDLIEEHRALGMLRVTDHKTGRKPDRIEQVIIGGGSVLQPVLYAMAIETGLRRPVSQGRLFYCTAAGSYFPHPIPINERTRAAGLEVLQVIDRAVESGFLAAAPTADACARCDFRPVCGPDVFRRVGRKPIDRLADLAALRSRP
jgi:CRISPR/Cas system-associated exonuclease Cas4 (RecB family)